MRYTVINVDESRQIYVNAIHETMRGHTHVPTVAVDARDPQQLIAAREKYPYPIHTGLWTPKNGMIGVWYSMLNVWEHGGPIIHFEDDSMIHPNFHEELEKRLAQMPADTDFMSLFLPLDHAHDYTYDKHVTEDLARPYNTYGGVSMYFTERGVEKIMALVKEQGITCQWDDWLYRMARNYRLNGYVPKPTAEPLVSIFVLESFAQNGGMYVG